MGNFEMKFDEWLEGNKKIIKFYFVLINIWNIHIVNHFKEKFCKNFKIFFLGKILKSFLFREIYEIFFLEKIL